MPIQVAIACEPLGDCQVLAATGVEAMSALPRWRVEVLAADGELDL